MFRINYRDINPTIVGDKNRFMTQNVPNVGTANCDCKQMLFCLVDSNY